VNPSFPHRMVAVIARIVLAVVEDLPAFVADAACLVAVPVSLWLLHRLAVHGAVWIGRHVRRDALDREYAELCGSFGADDSTDAEQLPGVPQLPTRQLHRRPRRFPGRRMRRHTTSTSNSDRMS